MLAVWARTDPAHYAAAHAAAGKRTTEQVAQEGCVRKVLGAPDQRGGAAEQGARMEDAASGLPRRALADQLELAVQQKHAVRKLVFRLVGQVEVGSSVQHQAVVWDVVQPLQLL